MLTLRAINYVDICCPSVQIQAFRASNTILQSFFENFGFFIAEFLLEARKLRAHGLCLRQVVRDIGEDNVATLRRLCKVFIALDLLEAHPAEKDPASRADHLVAPIYLGYRELAVGARLGAPGDVVEIQLLLNLHGLDLMLLFISDANFESGTPLEEVVLVLTGEAELESALSTLPEILRPVYLCRRVTLRIWAPAEVFHGFDGLVEGESRELPYQLWVHTQRLQVEFCQESLAPGMMRAEKLTNVTSSYQICNIVSHALLAEVVLTLREHKEVLLSLEGAIADLATI